MCATCLNGIIYPDPLFSEYNRKVLQSGPMGKQVPRSDSTTPTPDITKYRNL